MREITRADIADLRKVAERFENVSEYGQAIARILHVMMACVLSDDIDGMKQISDVSFEVAKYGRLRVSELINQAHRSHDLSEVG